MFKVRKCVEEDASVLGQFNADMAFETEGKKLDLARVTEGARSLILKPKLGQYYIAVAEDETPLGCTMVTYEMNARLGGIVCMIQSVFVVKEWRNKGVFRSLF